MQIPPLSAPIVLPPHWGGDAVARQSALGALNAPPPQPEALREALLGLPAPLYALLWLGEPRRMEDLALGCELRASPNGQAHLARLHSGLKHVDLEMFKGTRGKARSGKSDFDRWRSRLLHSELKSVFEANAGSAESAAMILSSLAQRLGPLSRPQGWGYRGKESPLCIAAHAAESQEQDLGRWLDAGTALGILDMQRDIYAPPDPAAPKDGAKNAREYPYWHTIMPESDWRHRKSAQWRLAILQIEHVERFRASEMDRVALDGLWVCDARLHLYEPNAEQLRFHQVNLQGFSEALDWLGPERLRADRQWGRKLSAFLDHSQGEHRQFWLDWLHQRECLPLAQWAQDLDTAPKCLSSPIRARAAGLKLTAHDAQCERWVGMLASEIERQGIISGLDAAEPPARTAAPAKRRI